MPEQDGLGKELASRLGDDFSEFRVLVAWAKVSGLARIDSAVGAFRERGGTTQIILGIDANGGTWEGLEQAAAMFDHAYVFHDSGNRTFHPKVYLLRSHERATVWVGSGNLTRGGLFSNYEAIITADLDRTDASDEVMLNQIDAYFDWFISREPSCQSLTEELIAALRSETGGLIQSEREQNKRSSSRRSRTDPSSGVFGQAISGLASAPPAPTSTLSSDREDEDSRVAAAPPQPAGHEGSGNVVPHGPAVVSPGFFKRLSPNDVSTTSSPGQIVIPIGFLDFFPELFLEKDETSTGGPRQMGREVAAVFQDGAWTKSVTGRVILYEPATTHPRPNVELRFTFRDRDISGRLSAGDYLVFEEMPSTLSVTRRPGGSFETAYGWL